MGHKVSYHVQEKLFFGKISWRRVVDIIRIYTADSYLKLNNYLNPILVNRYKREYYIDVEKKIRLTFDTCIKYFPQNNPCRPNLKQHCFTQPHSIMEIKMDPDSENRLSQIINDIPFRVTKSSKYVTGVQNCVHAHLLFT